MIITDLFEQIFFRPILNLLIIILNFLHSIGVPGALGFSIIILTVIVRFLVWPFITSQIKTTRKMAELKPHLDALKEKHKDRQALAAAQMQLYKDHGVSPAGGCLPALAQFPVFIALVNTISTMFNSHDGLQKINALLYSPSLKLHSLPDPNFFGLNLAVKPSDFATHGIFLLLIPLVAGTLTFVQSKMAMSQPVKPRVSDSPKEVKEKIQNEDTMAQVQSQMVYMMPVMVAFIGFTFPIGLAFYWNTYTLISIYHQYKVAGWGGMEGIIKNLKLKFASR